MKIRINGQPVRLDFRPFNSGGKGGQHSNKTLNAIEVTATLPDGRVVQATSQTSKSQHRNKRLALQVLVGRIREAVARPKTRGRDDVGRIRTYHAVRNDVVDHASGVHRSYRDVVEGDALGDLIDARRRALEMAAAVDACDSNAAGRGPC